MHSSPYRLEERTLAFSKDIIHLCKTIKPSTVTTPIVGQLIRSATSIGANYAEANNASSKTDFRNKIFIAKKEAAETKYWLALISEISADRKVIERLRQEAQYILMTLQKIVNTLRDSTVKGASKTLGERQIVNGERH